MVPEHLWRFPTREAIDRLAQRFGLPNTSDMQDWEWEVADETRISEFLTAYVMGGLSHDERFVLLEILLQSFEQSTRDLEGDGLWKRLLSLIDRNIELHIYSVWYWSYVGYDNPEDWYRVTPFLRAILSKHRHRFEVSKPA